MNRVPIMKINIPPPTVSVNNLQLFYLFFREILTISMWVWAVLFFVVVEITVRPMIKGIS